MSEFLSKPELSPYQIFRGCALSEVTWMSCRITFVAVAMRKSFEKQFAEQKPDEEFNTSLRLRGSGMPDVLRIHLGSW